MRIIFLQMGWFNHQISRWWIQTVDLKGGASCWFDGYFLSYLPNLSPKMKSMKIEDPTNSWKPGPFEEKPTTRHPQKRKNYKKNSGVSKIIHQLAASKFVQPTIDLYLLSLAYKQSYLGYPMFPIIFPKFQGPQLTAVASQNPRPKELTLQTLRSLLGLQLSCSWADIVVRRPIRGANTGSFSQFAP